MNDAQPKTSSLAIVALVCIFLCAPLAVVLGIIALVKINDSKGQLTGKGLAIAAIVAPVAMVPVMGILAAIAIPNFIRYQLRSKGAEAKVVLRSLTSTQLSHYEEKGYFVAARQTPSEAPSVVKAEWDAAPCPAECGKDNPAACSELSCLGYDGPAGPVYFRYACSTGGKEGSFICGAYGDLDGDGRFSVFIAGKGSLESLAAPLPAEIIEACARVAFRDGEVIECTNNEF